MVDFFFPSDDVEVRIHQDRKKDGDSYNKPKTLFDIFYKILEVGISHVFRIEALKILSRNHHSYHNKKKGPAG